MNLVEDDQMFVVRREIELRVRKLGAVGRQFQVHVGGLISALIGQRQRKCGFADLSGPQQGHDWKASQVVAHLGERQTGDHAL